jgi:hypothetical protein
VAEGSRLIAPFNLQLSNSDSNTKSQIKKPDRILSGNQLLSLPVGLLVVLL